MRYVAGFAVVLLMFAGCSQTVAMRALEPAAIDRAAYTKKIAVSPFENDHVNLSGKIEAEIAGTRLDGEPYFTTISRRDIDQILREQRFQNSGLLEPGEAVDMGRIIGAEAIISGSVSTPSKSDSHFDETRTRCEDDKCKKISIYQVRCTKRKVSLWAELRMVDVEQGDIIYADRISKSKYWSHCYDDSRVLPSRHEAAQQLADEITKEFTIKLTPHYRRFAVTLLEKGDLEYTDAQNKLLKNALEFIEQERLAKAETLLIELIDSTAERSYVAFYNLGVVKEAQGYYDEAKAIYDRADDLMMEPVEEISEAYKRIRRTIADYQKSQSQITR